MTRERRRAVWVRAALVVALLAGAAPIAAETIDRIASGWRPVGDDAMVVFLAGDVLTRDSPSHGMPSTLSGTGETLYHPGPMLFWVLALPVTLTNSAPAAVVLTLAALQLAAVLTIVWLVHRRARAPGVVVALVAIAALELALGRDLLLAPVNLYCVLLPMLAFLAAAWAAACGDPAALVPGVLFGSLVAQSHYLFLPVCGSVAIAAVIAYLVERHRAGERAVIPWRKPVEIAAIVLGVVAWLPVLWNVVVAFPGNFVKSVRGASTDSGPTMGAWRMIHAAVRVVAQAPLWSSSRAAAGDDLFGSVGLLAVGAALLGVALIVFAARRDGRVARLALVVSVALASAAVMFARVPSGNSLFVTVGHAGRFRMLYVIGAAALALLLGSAMVVLRTSTGGVATTGAVVVSVATVVALALGASMRRTPNEVYAHFIDSRATSTVVGDLAAGARRGLPRDRAYLIARSFDLSTADEWAFERGLLVELRRRGFRVRVLGTDPYLGDRDALRPGERADALEVVTGAHESTPGAQLVVTSDVRMRIAQQHLDTARRAVAAAGATTHIDDLDVSPTFDELAEAVRRAPSPLRTYTQCPGALALVLRGQVANGSAAASALCRYQQAVEEVTVAPASLFVVRSSP